jgi:L,D-peptidoglycan transpeptidase YkuD (ErfK/YbiS/YcfS/YnhG family)
MSIHFAVTRSVTTIHVCARNAAAQRGILVAGNLRLPCALGRWGRSYRKREGDGATPRGVWRILKLLLRPGAMRFVTAALPRRVLRRHDGWCDDPRDRNYNRPVSLPYPRSCEELWRRDRLYDAIGILDHNQSPRIAFHGSAVFLHIAGPEFSPTQGCIAVSHADMRKLLAICSSKTRFLV